MKKKEPIDLSTMDAETLKLMLNDKNVLMRLELNSNEPGYRTGTVIEVKPRSPRIAGVRVRYDEGVAGIELDIARNYAGLWLTSTASRKLVAWRTVQMPVETPEPRRPLKPAPKEEFSDKGIMPSDHPGINEMLKKGFKEIFGGELQPAPAKRTLPSNKALFIVASEKYLGLGFNDGLE